MAITHKVQAHRTPEQYKVEEKTYYHQHNYARMHPWIDNQALEIAFANHRYSTDDRRIQEQLDMVADIPGTMVFTRTDSEAAREVVEQAKHILQDQLQQTAIASDQVNNRQVTLNTPIVQVPISVGSGVNLGGANSINGGIAAAPISTPMTTAAVQTGPAKTAAEQRAQAAQQALAAMNPGTNTQ